MPDFSQVQNYPDINFVDTSVENLLSAAISAYQDTYEQLTSNSVTVQPGDDVYILLYTQALRDYSVLQSINAAARQNFLKYAAGEYLDNLSANTGNVRSSSKPAVTTIQFNLGKAQSIVITIPQGTRISPGNGLYFATDEELDIPIGNTAGTVTATCLTDGNIGNGYIPGQINVLVDPIAFVFSVTNTQTTEGGSDAESDLSLAEKDFASPEGFSVAGPAGAYDYFARQYSPAVIDTKTTSPSANAVNMKVLLTGGQLPNQTFLNELETYIGADDKRPLDDQFTAEAPDVVNYDINLTYYIDPANAGNAANIATAVTAAVSNFVLWEKSKIGRDIIPDELTTAIRNVGAKRSVITSPAFTQISETSLAVASSKITVTNGGIDNA